MNRGHLILFVATLGVFGALTSTAQQAAEVPPAPAPAATTGTVDDKKLDQFAVAYVQIQAIQQEAAKQPPARDPAAMQQKQNELQAKMTQAVQQSGLDIADFNTIVQTMMVDTELRTRVQAKVAQERAKTAPAAP